MTVINVMLTFPFVLLALAVIAVLGPSLANMIIVLGGRGLADLRAGHPGRDPGPPRARVRGGRPRARHEPRSASIFRQILPNLDLADRGDRHACRWPR